MLDENGVSLSVDHDLAGDIWENRPVLSCEPVTELDIKWAGESRADKCARIRKAMEKKGADLFVLTSLDDIAWLLNIRGGDIHCCPVVLSYLVMTKTEIRLFANEKAFQTTLPEINLKMQTGIIVDFRTREVLRNEIEDGAYPLLYSQQIGRAHV